MGRLHGMMVAEATSFSEAEALQRLQEADELAKEQSVALAEIHDKVNAIRDAAIKVGEFNQKLNSVEADLLDAIDDAEKIAGPDTGVGQLAQAVARIKALSTIQQDSIGRAKQALDPLIPRTA